MLRTTRLGLRFLLALGLLALAGDARGQGLISVPIVGGSAEYVRGLIGPVPVLRLGGPLGAGPARVPDAAHPFSGGFQVVPTGILQTTGPAPQALAFTHGIFSKPAVPATVGRFKTEPVFFQIRTNIGLPLNATLPTQTFAAGGRSGPATVTVCPGTLTAPGLTTAQNPGCVGTEGRIDGLVRYQALRNQFGGLHRLALTGTVDLAVNAGGATSAGGVFDIGACGGMLNPPGTGATSTNPPGTVLNPPYCAAAMFRSDPFTGPGGVGGPFGSVRTTTVPSPLGSNLININVTPSGLIGSAVPIGSVHIINDGTSWAGPYTTGRVFVSAPDQPGGGQVLTVTGRDARNASGQGSISLVSGTLASRVLTGDSANSGHIALVIPEPSTLLAAATALGALGLLYAGSRQRR